jgi:hypothetical protein
MGYGLIISIGFRTRIVVVSGGIFTFFLKKIFEKKMCGYYRRSLNALGDFLMTKQGKPNHGRRSKTNTVR